MFVEYFHYIDLGPSQDHLELHIFSDFHPGLKFKKRGILRRKGIT